MRTSSKVGGKIRHVVCTKSEAELAVLLAGARNPKNSICAKYNGGWCGIQISWLAIPSMLKLCQATKGFLCTRTDGHKGPCISGVLDYGMRIAGPNGIRYRRP